MTNNTTLTNTTSAHKGSRDRDNRRPLPQQRDMQGHLQPGPGHERRRQRCGAGGLRSEHHIDARRADCQLPPTPSEVDGTAWATTDQFSAWWSGFATDATAASELR